jgi:hypothetical protein
MLIVAFVPGRENPAAVENKRAQKSGAEVHGCRNLRGLGPPGLERAICRDAARAAKEKKKKQTDAAPAQAATKPKVYTNEDLPESKSSDSQPAPSKVAESKTTSSSDAKSTPASVEEGIPHGPDSAHVDFKFTSTRLKRPAKAETVWTVKNTSDHFERVEIKTIINGPCGYHRQYSGGDTGLSSGQQITDTWQTDLTVLATDCLGTYSLELRASVAGKLLGSASDSITVE